MLAKDDPRRGGLRDGSGRASIASHGSPWTGTSPRKCNFRHYGAPGTELILKRARMEFVSPEASVIGNQQGRPVSTSTTTIKKEPAPHVGARSSAGGRATHPTTFLTLLAFGSLLAGLGEFATRLLVFRWSPYVDRTFHLNPQAVWMGPVAALPLSLLAVGATWLLTRKIRSETLRFGLPLGVVLFVAALQAGFTTTRVHPVAVAMLALGGAVQLARYASSRQGATARVVRASTAIMAVISIGGGLGWNAWQRHAEDRRYQALPAVAGESVNVLMLILDTVRASSLSVYGYPRPTSPFLERFAADGIRFDRAMATAPWTLPSHGSFFTGRYPHELDVGWNSPLDDTTRTIAEAFGANGFATAGFVANPYYGQWFFGLDRGFHHYADYPRNVSEVLGNSNLNRRLLRIWNARTGQYWQFGRKNAASVNTEFLDWLDRRPKDKPFFAFLNYIDAHTPYRPPAPYRSLYLEREPPTRRANQGMGNKPTGENIRGLQDAYDGAITYLDAQLAELFRQLEARGVTSNTIVLISSDHGEAFGEHGFVEHGVSLYLPELHVPLIVKLPGGKNRGCVVRNWVTLRDIPATLASEARLNPAEPFVGSSLLDYCTEGAVERRVASPVLSEMDERTHLQSWYPSASGPMSGIMIGDLHYVRTGAREQLFDTSIDFAELRDLSGDPAHMVNLEAARTALRNAGSTRR